MNQRTIDVWDDTLSPEQPCRGSTCKQKIVWAQVVKSGKRMCFNAPAVPLRTKTDAQSGRVVAEMDFDDNHWASCPDRDGFR